MSERRVRPLILVPLLALAVGLAAVPAARAQDDDHQYQRFALGIGGGLVDAGAATSPYLMASLRIRLGGDDERGSGIAGYLEPEIGYWDDDVDDFGSTVTDLLVGVNIGGAVSLRSVQYFVGAGIGVHFLDTETALGIGVVQDDDTSVGLNAQFGVDVAVGETISLFGVGRIDLVDKLEDDQQAKVYLGVRFRF